MQNTQIKESKVFLSDVKADPIVELIWSKVWIIKSYHRWCNACHVSTTQTKAFNLIDPYRWRCKSVHTSQHSGYRLCKDYYMWNDACEKLRENHTLWIQTLQSSALSTGKLTERLCAHVQAYEALYYIMYTCSRRCLESLGVTTQFFIPHGP